MEECELVFLAGQKAEALVQKLKARSLTLALSESCTAGLVSGLLADTPGVSAVLWGAFVCYTQEAKVSMLGIENSRLIADGLVSKETAASMAAMALQKSGADIAAAVTGLAGPEGDGSDVPVGTVWAAAGGQKGGITAKEFHFTGSRKEIRIRAAIAVLDIIESVVV